MQVYSMFVGVVCRPDSRLLQAVETRLPNHYLPMQNEEKISPSKSSVLIAPVIEASSVCMSLKSSASSSPALLVLKRRSPS